MEPIAGKLVERKTKVPPCKGYMLMQFSTGIKEWLPNAFYREDEIPTADSDLFRVFHLSDQPPQLPDREKLAKWLFESSCLEPPAIEWEDLGGGVIESCFKNADAVIALLRDGIPAELMPDEK